MGNANGEGSIYKRMREGQARPATSVPSATPTRRAIAQAPHGVRQDPHGRCADKMKAVRDCGSIAVRRSRTHDARVGDWLAHWRATTLAASDRKASTRELYGNLSRRHLETGDVR